ncbi:hypothetical protein AK812_SmicGene12109 [Symbiodinium microadriaticum]|uniref:Uncharacterized protein n=1 Tax=Symbiodinium microadriaticum TaxID=2951 RepID=A0A1Q9EBQ6_SYMMI|nr:hypothetical protein AK812_SmicGene12109 [Symbiodinium microadriaticum]
MANAFTESQPVFLDRIKLAGVPDAAKDRLLASGVDTVAKFAFAAGQPGETPSDDKLNALVRVADEDIPVATTAALRRLAFESQTLMIAQVKALVENESEDQRSELAPAERAERLRQQGIRLAGISRRGESECSYQSYDLVMKMIQDNTITYLSPSKFGSRHEELKMDKPRKELDVVSGTVQVKDKHQEVLCSPHTPLLLHHALQRRALAMDLVGAATFDIVQEYHEFLLSHLSMDPPPGYRRIDVSQVLEADRTGWLRLAEKLPTGLKRNAAGVLPLDEDLPKLQGDPRVVFHLMPLPVGGAIQRNTEDNSDGGPRKQFRGRGRGKGNGKGKQVRQPSSMPVELKGKWSTTRSFAGLGDWSLPFADSAYPVELCRLWAELLVSQLLDLGAKPLPKELSDAQPKLHWAAQAATSVQIPRKRLPPLVKEWKEVVQLESSCPILPGVTKLKEPFLLSDEVRRSLPLSSLPEGCKVLRRETRGVGGSAKDQSVVVVIDEDDSQVAPSPLVDLVIDKGDSQVAPSPLVPNTHPGEPSLGAPDNTHVRGPTSHAKSLVPPEVNSHPAEVFAHARLEANDVTRESVEHLIELLSHDGEEPARSSGAQLQGEFSWSSGAYVHGVIGRRQNLATFPWCTKLCAALINRWVPDLAYTCISLVRNVKAPLHVDRNNAKGSENAIIAISDFSGGGLWVESKEGSIPCPDGQHDLKGDVLEFQDRLTVEHVEGLGE